MKYFSMFSGIGGFEKGIEQAYENINQELWEKGQDTGSLPRHNQSNTGSESNQRQSPTCVGYSEIDKYAIQIYERHFKHKNYGDATTIIASELPDFSLLVGGFPCQAFSIAGKRMGLDDARGTLFYDIARIAKEKRPQHLLLENVKGLLSHDNGRTFKLIISTFAELGYNLEWQVLNSKNFGVPQNRERVFIIGHLGGCCGRQVFPLTGSNEENNGENISTALDANYWKGTDNHGQRTHLAVPLKFLDRNQKNYQGEYSFTVDTVNSGGLGYNDETLQYKGLCAKIGVYASTQETNAIKILSILQKEIGTEAFAKWGFTILDSFQETEILQPILYGKSLRHKTDKGTSQMDDSTLSRSETMSESSLLLLWQSQNRCSPQKPRLARQFTDELNEGLQELSQQDSPFRIRRLTPLEAERLQGYPDGWTEGVSDTQRYKTLGNSVTVNVIEEIIKRLYGCG